MNHNNNDNDNFDSDEQEEQSGEKGIGDVLFSWKRKFDNYWYHYKVVTIFGIIILAFIIFAIAQCSFRVKGDVSIGYIGAQEINAEEYANLQSALDSILGEDLNGDGKVHTEFTQFSYMTQVQVENARAQGTPVDLQSLVTVQLQIDLELTEGNIILYFIDSEVYKELSAKNAFMPLEDSLGYIPEGANDAFTLKLGNLPCWDYYEGLYNLPASTVIAVRDMTVDEESDKTMQERYKNNLKMFKRLAEFKYLPEETT